MKKINIDKPLQYTMDGIRRALPSLVRATAGGPADSKFSKPSRPESRTE